ncbi:hypothetical protein [Aurantiacibacter rhizosphaerae]|uniref:Uncharacterized protein n=1 Tax=Aurantiacibacter rhizosphaerae TaxID=2691582 RepID=A0A844X7X5_9SPHN|nr:hypothetical protein [Aurantiacibacter rhizosphaerae]MWV26437.1 hypothetical protein [Aurantiacibacter rhizosphaerae]
MAKRKEPTGSLTENNKVTVEQSPGETLSHAKARKMLEPGIRHGVTASAFANRLIRDAEGPGVMEYIDHALELADEGEMDRLSRASRTLALQAVTLDAMFTELARRAANNLGDYIDASERYTRLALKAQANSRATLEALAKLHQPREQIVKHVHVNEGGQAVVADQIHQHRGEGKNARSDKQSHATGTAGQSPAMLSEDARGNGVSITGGKGSEALPNARRDKPGTT